MASIKGTIDIENVGLKTFSIENQKSRNRPTDATQKSWMLESKKISIVPWGLGDCLEGRIQFRTLL